VAGGLARPAHAELQQTLVGRVGHGLQCLRRHGDQPVTDAATNFDAAISASVPGCTVMTAGKSRDTVVTFLTKITAKNRADGQPIYRIARKEMPRAGNSTDSIAF